MTSSENKTDAGSIGLIVLVILAVIASIVMLISGSASALKLALIAALWAAVLGFFLVVRYRRQAQSAQEMLEVERAHWEETASANASAAAATAAASGSVADAEVLAQIRTELASIRSQLEELSGREWVYEPAALRAEARRIQELERATHATAAEEPDVNFTQQSSGAPSADAIAGRLGSQPTNQHNPLDSIISEKMRQQEQQQQQKQQYKQRPPQPQQSQQPRPPQQQSPASPFGRPEPTPQPTPQPAPQPAQSAQPAAQPTPRQEPAPQPAAKPAPQPAPQPAEAPSFSTDSFQTVKWDQGGIDTPIKHHRHRAPEEEPRQPQARGRRRSDEKREGAVSVAELLAQAKKRKDNK
ncbi:DUF6779 domain-containing protein [Corynebacterium sp.]|uniref:DUF6779 domain-containing protein n=1 Tax=Corynebacterium sp. TaxID=1720 RepID=UPI0026DBF64B|nr:DUF6779 domain-containing protein [Corynebacterium sp.]MDO5032259.1 zinc metalloprotease [Corynebacterium sp.]